tara:strand:+ start:1300 stop:1548 length:249 start_codon:yes stop_codon:yes gene_type:complete
MNSIECRFYIKDNKVILSLLKDEYPNDASINNAATNITSGYDKYIDQSVPERDITLMDYNSTSDSLYKLDYASILAEYQSEG